MATVIVVIVIVILVIVHTHIQLFMALFRDYPGEPVPEEIFFWTLWCKGR